MHDDVPPLQHREILPTGSISPVFPENSYPLGQLPTLVMHSVSRVSLTGAGVGAGVGVGVGAGVGAGVGVGVGVGDDDAQHKFMVIGECVAYVVPEFPAKE
jgi:hypothetical protein